MEEIKKRKPTSADYEKRRFFDKSFNETDLTDEENFDYLDFMNSIDWRPEVFEENGKYGLKTALGEMALPALFDDMSLSFEVGMGDRVVVVQNGKWGIAKADGKGTWLVLPEFDYIGYPNPLTHVCNDGKWGVLNIFTNECLIDPVCDKIFADNGHMFINGIGCYETNGKTGVVTAYGAFTGPLFDEIESDPEGAVKVKFNGEWGYINEENQFTTDEEEASYYYYEI